MSRHQLKSIATLLIILPLFDANGLTQVTSWKSTSTTGIPCVPGTPLAGEQLIVEAVPMVRPPNEPGDTKEPPAENIAIIKLDPATIKLDPATIKLDPATIKLDPATIKLEPATIKLESTVAVEPLEISLNPSEVTIRVDQSPPPQVPSPTYAYVPAPPPAEGNVNLFLGVTIIGLLCLSGISQTYICWHLATQNRDRQYEQLARELARIVRESCPMAPSASETPKS